MNELKIINNAKREHGDIVYLETHQFYNSKPFPNSYKDFVKTYGYGRSLGQFIIYIPLGDYGDSWEVRAEEIKDTYYHDITDEEEDIWFDLEPDGSVDLIKRWEPFALSENGYYLFWDPENGKQDEFDIYITDFKAIGVLKAGSDLNEVFSTLTDNSKFKTLLPFSTQPLPKTFEALNIK